VRKKRPSIYVYAPDGEGLYAPRYWRSSRQRKLHPIEEMPYYNPEAYDQFHNTVMKDFEDILGSEPAPLIVMHFIMDGTFDDGYAEIYNPDTKHFTFEL
jgi:hypothetical protein